MAFTRDEIAAYEKQPVTQIDDKTNPFDGATKAEAATAAAVAAVASGKTDATPAAKKPADDAAADPSGDDTDSGPSVTGDGTSDEQADSSTATADPSGESETSDDDSGAEGEEAPTARPTPKKGSAAERIQELLDLTEGYKEFGHLKTQELQEARAELARLRAGSGTSTPVKPEVPPVETDDPMPDLADTDINFDTDKLRAKTQKWIKSQIARGTQTAVKEMTGQSAIEKLRASVDSKLTTAAATYKDWEVTVVRNPILAANQLAPDAAQAVAESEHTGAILYKFGKDKELAIRIAKQSPAQQLVSLGKIITQIEAEKTLTATATATTPDKTDKNPVAGAQPAKKKSLTQAPPPPKTTTAGGRATDRDITDPGMDMDEFARRHREEKQAKRTANRGKR